MESFTPHVAFLVQGSRCCCQLLCISVCTCYIWDSLCLLSGSVPGAVPVRHTSSPSSVARISMRTSTRQTQRPPSLPGRDYSERVKTIGGESHRNSCKLVPHLIVGVLDDSVEGGHQGLLQVEAAGVAGDFGVWQCLEENHQQEFAVKELCNWRFTRHCLMIFKNYLKKKIMIDWSIVLLTIAAVAKTSANFLSQNTSCGINLIKSVSQLLLTCQVPISDPTVWLWLTTTITSLPPKKKHKHYSCSVWNMNIHTRFGVHVSKAWGGIGALTEGVDKVKCDWQQMHHISED